MTEATPDPTTPATTPGDPNTPVNKIGIQSALSLFMPLADPNSALHMLTEYQSKLGAALDSVGTVHFARFMLLNVDQQVTLVLFTEYDGDFTQYVKDFVDKIGEIFDALLAHVIDPPPTPVAQHVDEFVNWVHQHDRTTPAEGLLTFYSAYPQMSVKMILGPTG